MISRPPKTKIREIFAGACDLTDADRSRYLDNACGGDDMVRAEVESLLALDRAEGGILAEPDLASGRGLGDSFTLPLHESPAPERIGRFKLIRRLGMGGMAEVYEAEQDDPARLVALKIIDLAAVSPGMSARFEREGQIQASLHHTGIAQVFEAGVHQQGRRQIRFFAMELVTGRPITEHVTREKLTTQDRLALFLRVCDAVGFAHQNGIIHRDLKPSNILVAMDRGVAQPRVLDFGIAKRTTPGLNDATICEGGHTSPGQLIGTLSYMSPEQITGAAEAVDTRADIYALGLILFEMLTGKPALAVSGLSLVDAARRIVEDAPVRLGSLVPSLRGDLETIVSKAISKDKARRYDSVSEFAADIRRYLDQQPITARPATAIYQFRKFAGRNRALVVTAALGAVVLAAGVVATGMQARAATIARDDEREVSARYQLLAEEAQRLADRSRKDAEISRAVAESLRDVFYLATPLRSQGKDPTLRQAIDLAADRFGKGDEIPPEAEAIVRNVFGIVFRDFSEFDKAQAQFSAALEIRQRVLPPDHADIGEVRQNIGVNLSQAGKPEQGVEHLIEALRIQKAALGAESPKVAQATYNLGRTMLRLKRFQESRALLLDSLEIHRRIEPDKKAHIAYHLSTLSGVERALNNADAAERYAIEGLEVMRASVQPGNLAIATSLYEVAAARMMRNDFAGADEPSREAFGIAFDVLGSNPAHVTLAAIRDQRLTILDALGLNDQAATVRATVPPR
ncbi:MAG: serine/threonine protein kinase [Tepidisphaera sp.]